LRGIIDRVPNFSTSGPKVVEAILNLPIPFDIYVSPAGGRDTRGEAWKVLKGAPSREVRQKRVFISHPFPCRVGEFSLFCSYGLCKLGFVKIKRLRKSLQRIVIN